MDSDLAEDYAATQEAERRQQLAGSFSDPAPAGEQTTSTPTTTGQTTKTTPTAPPRRGFIPANRAMSGAAVALRNVAEVPTQVVGGFIDAANKTLMYADENPFLNPTALFSPTLREETGNKGPLPTTNEPQTPTGEFARKIAEFWGPYALASKALAGAGFARTATNAISTAISTMISAEPHEKRLADLMEGVPIIGAPIKEYLGSSDDESRAAAMLKSGLENAGLVMGVDALVGALGMAKAAVKTHILGDLRGETAAETAIKAAQAAGTPNLVRPTTEADLGLLGSATDERALIPAPAPAASPAADRLAAAAADTATADPAAMAARAEGLAAEGVAEGAKQPASSKFYINWRRVDTPEKIKALLQGSADADIPGLHAARISGATQTTDQVKALAESMDLTPEQFIGRQRGPMDAATAYRARQFLNASAEQVADAAQKAVQSENPVDVFVYRRALAGHTALQREVFAARTETARALRSWAIPAGTDTQRAAAIREMLAQTGGVDKSLAGARMIADIAASPTGGVKGINKAAMLDTGKRWLDGLYSVWMQSILSGPPTHVANFASNAVQAAKAIPERGLTSYFDPDAVPAGEATQLAYGMMKGVSSGFRMAGRALVSGESQFGGMTKLEPDMKALIAPDLVAQGGDFARWVGYAWNAVQPGNWLTAGDDFWKGILYGGEIQAQAFRQATQEGLTGDALGQRIAALVANPDPSIGETALSFATYKTFQTPVGPMGKWIMEGRAKVPLVRWVLPFVRTPSNILKTAIEESPFAPALSQVRADIAAGGVKAATAKAKVAMGSATMLWAVDMVMQGRLTGGGPSDRNAQEELRQTGWRPWSVQINGRYYALNRVDPLGYNLGWAARAIELMGNLSNDDADKLATIGVSSFLDQTANRSYLTGLFGAVDAIHDPTFSLEKYATNQVTSFLAPKLFESIGRGIDPVIRETKNVDNRHASFMDNVISNIEEKYGMSDAAPKRDVLGDVITMKSGIGFGWDMVSPIYSSASKDDPIRQALVRNRAAHKPSPHIGDVPLNDKEYSALLQMSGERSKRQLAPIVNSPGFARMRAGRDSPQAHILEQVLRDNQEWARAQLPHLFPDLRAALAADADRKRMEGR